MMSRVFLATAIILIPSAALAQASLIDGWTELLRSAARLIIIGAAALGILYAAVSLWRAYHAPETDRAPHMAAALFSGVFTILGVVVGWLSGLIVASGG